ncbi:hypothetical protein [Pseudoalteromonas umbrosa]|uniref:hypothetical protein n=1 Tax=Pseudoalteromonas umbrosa TaxID=3048489 RepID=UPI0024C409BC|nr:hypothetical protein [Pseudoalteromonas sp. B95]MDK1289777.1 hypothetical protein [Pseudoalteromonas sp. B95]
MHFPTHLLDPQKLSITAKSKTQLDPSHAGPEYANQLGDPHKWELSLTTVPLVYAKTMELFAFANTLGGRFKYFRLPNPFPAIGKGLGDDCRAKDGAYAMATSISVIGATQSLVDALMPGDFISFIGHEKAYMVTEPVTINSLGHAIVRFSPSLRKAVGAGEKIHSCDGVSFNVALKTDLLKLDLVATKYRNSFVLQLSERLHD